MLLFLQDVTYDNNNSNSLRLTNNEGMITLKQFAM